MTALALLAVAALGASPQGVTVRVETPAAKGASAADAEAVAKAVQGELKAQGYGVVTAGKAHASITGTVTKGDGGFLVALTLTRESDAQVLDDARGTAKAAAELPRVGVEVAKALATEIRIAWGVRTKLKLK